MNSYIGESIDNDTILKFYKWFQAAMRQVGRSIQMPKDTDPTKTYQFRWVKVFANKVINELQLDNKTIKELIVNIVHYAKRNNLLNKGAGILSMEQVVDICANTLESSIDRSDSLVGRVRRCHAFLESREFDADRLGQAVRVGGYSNLYSLHDSGRLPLEYIALSKSCSSALRRIEEREQIANERTLLKIRARILYDDELNSKITEIMGPDLLKAGVVGV